jgi:hypothetical protein
MGKHSRHRAQWLQVGVVAVGLGAAAAAGQGLAIASPADSPDPGGVSSTTDSVSGAGNTAATDVSASGDDQSTAGAAKVNHDVVGRWPNLDAVGAAELFEGW